MESEKPEQFDEAHVFESSFQRITEGVVQVINKIKSIQINYFIRHGD